MARMRLKARRLSHLNEGREWNLRATGLSDSRK